MNILNAIEYVIVGLMVFGFLFDEKKPRRVAPGPLICVNKVECLCVEAVGPQVRYVKMGKRLWTFAWFKRQLRILYFKQEETVRWTPIQNANYFYYVIYASKPASNMPVRSSA